MTFQLGSSGDDIKAIQSFLKSLGYTIAVNGIFDAITDVSIKLYQKAKNITIDGIIGPQTLSKLIADGFVLPSNRGLAVASDLTNKFADRLLYHCLEFENDYEIVNNTSWDDPDIPGIQKDKSDNLIKYMLQISPWGLGEPYCAAGVGAIILMSLEDCDLPTNKFKSVWTAHVMTNVNRLKQHGVLSIVPSLNSVWMARFGETSKGHTGIVIDIKGDHIITIEPNTIQEDTGDPNRQRTGDGFYRRKFNKRGRGLLQTQGFLSSENILKFFVS
jgi:hypothetical protein